MSYISHSPLVHIGLRRRRQRNDIELSRSICPVWSCGGKRYDLWQRRSCRCLGGEHGVEAALKCEVWRLGEWSEVKQSQEAQSSSRPLLSLLWLTRGCAFVLALATVRFMSDESQIYGGDLAYGSVEGLRLPVVFAGQIRVE